ncbi:DUF3850 domain-containing protein [Tumebacillus lipolyticus]|uniref:DUF3850 domain-containing protein n=1 Tax=Tumebacillus lipolyticus TaxID=1280370 RepID=A0ABW4ZSM2_9BACL
MSEERQLGSIVFHHLKTWPEHFEAVTHPDPERRKTVEIRYDDRKFSVGDILHLHEWDPVTENFTGEETIRRVTHILKGQPWLPEGYVALSIRKVV